MFSGSSLIYPLSMTYPSKVTVVTVENRQISRSHCSTRTWQVCLMGVLEKIRMSSSYMMTKQFRKSQSMSVNRAWNTAGALVRPNGLTKYSKHLRWVLKAVFNSSTSLILTRWYAFHGSSLVKMVALCRS